jgi:hypothetical protein
MLKYYFTGFGNYSSDFGWDSGMSSSIEGKATPAYKSQEGVDAEVNSYAGSRNAYGTVCAPSKKRAQQLLNEFDESFETIEFEREKRPRIKLKPIASSVPGRALAAK